MNELKILEKPSTLVDHVEKSLFRYIEKSGLKVGDPIPNEGELCEALGVSRSVLREALSRLRMLGIITSRTRRGMILSEPNLFGGLHRILKTDILTDQVLFNLLGFRVALELGLCSTIIDNVRNEDIEELEGIVERGTIEELNFYDAHNEQEFHAKLYEITGNQTIMQFQELIYPVSVSILKKFRGQFSEGNVRLQKQGNLVTHERLLEHIKNRDAQAFREAMEWHFFLYKELLTRQQQATAGHAVS